MIEKQIQLLLSIIETHYQLGVLIEATVMIRSESYFLAHLCLLFLTYWIGCIRESD